MFALESETSAPAAPCTSCFSVVYNSSIQGEKDGGAGEGRITGSVILTTFVDLSLDTLDMASMFFLFIMFVSQCRVRNSDKRNYFFANIFVRGMVVKFRARISSLRELRWLPRVLLSCYLYL